MIGTGHAALGGVSTSTIRSRTIPTDVVVRQGRQHPERRHLSHVMWKTVLRVEHAVTLTGPFLAGYHRLSPTIPESVQEQYERATVLQLERRDRFIAAGMPLPTPSSIDEQPHEVYGFAGWGQLSDYFDEPYLRGLVALDFVVSEYHVPAYDVRTAKIELVFAKRNAVRLAVHTEQPAKKAR